MDFQPTSLANLMEGSRWQRKLKLGGGGSSAELKIARRVTDNQVKVCGGKMHSTIPPIYFYWRNFSIWVLKSFLLGSVLALFGFRSVSLESLLRISFKLSCSGSLVLEHFWWTKHFHSVCLFNDDVTTFNIQNNWMLLVIKSFKFLKM